MKSVVAFFSEVKSELSKVTWPKKNEVTRLTTVVLLISLIIGLFVGGVDYIFTAGLTKLLAL
jgi:preprotein translocase subunit SecE